MIKYFYISKKQFFFNRHLLITSGAALQSLIPSLINAKEWIIVCKLKYIKRYTKQIPIHGNLFIKYLVFQRFIFSKGNVVMSLNVNHPLVRYEILQAFDLLQQTFNEVKSAYIVVCFLFSFLKRLKNNLD